MNSSARAAAPPRSPVIALAGNPNAGKTTLFNRLTGTRQHTGNYPGVTVERKEGALRHGGFEFIVVDLPGTYSLTACTEDERVARHFLIEARPDLVVDVVDASNLERNLYLAVQLMELGTPLVLALNMSDVADAQGCRVDTELLSRLLGVTIVRTAAVRNEGIDRLKDLLAEVAGGAPLPRPAPIHYGREVEAEIQSLAARLADEGAMPDGCSAAWTALKLLEGDEEVREAVRRRQAAAQALLQACDEAKERIRKTYGDHPEAVIADQRYGLISGACLEAVRITAESRHDVSDRIDDVLTHRLLGFPIFLLSMYLMFRLVFTVGEPPMRWIESLFGWLGARITLAWPPAQAEWLRSLLVDGVVGGVGGVVVFLPNIMLLFLAIALLEDSGYMARVAFIMDRMMHRIGLHGKSFIPMLIGFGCTVPAIMATRTLESRRDRLITMLILPLVSCGARLPIYALFLSAFFPQSLRTPLLLLLYLIGILLAVCLAKVLQKTLFRGDSALFVMELPPYRLPTWHSILLHTWERGKQFLRKAGTVVLGLSILLWMMTSYPKLPERQTRGLSHAEAHSAQLSHSLAGQIGQVLEPAMRHVGFDWKASTALIGALAAKEVFVSQLGILNSLGETEPGAESLRASLQRQYSPLQAFCIMLFCLISTPCMMTVAATRQESGSWKWAALQLVGLTALAYAATFAVYQAGLLIFRQP